MTHTLRNLKTSDGLTLQFRHYPARKTRAVAVCLHGIQSHAGWYEYSSQRLADEGFDVYFADRRGSGVNHEQRGHADHGLRLVHDVRQLLRQVRREHPGRIVTLLGISWGGKTAAAVAACCPDLVQRLALLYPGLHPRIGPNLWQRFQLNFARRHDIRHHIVKLPLDTPALFTDVPKWQQFIQNDSLALHQVTSGFLNSGRDLDNIIPAQPATIRQPTLLMLAGKDQIIDNQKTRKTVTALQPTDTTILEYPQAAHTLEFDTDRAAIFGDLVQWLQQRLEQ